MASLNVLSTEEFQQSLGRVTAALETLQHQVRARCMFLLEGHAFLATKMQAESSLILQRSDDQLLHNIIIDHCTRAERAGAGSFFLTLSLILDGLRSGQKKAMSRAIANQVLQGSFVPTWEELAAFIKRSLDDEFLSTLVFEALQLSGLEGKIFFELATNDVVSVEQVSGFNFDVEYPIQSQFKHRDVKCLIIDGFIETVSEIHHLFQKASETKEPILLVTRGFSPDVVSTLKVNNDRKTLCIMPAFIKFDFDGVNALNDIATVCCADVISSNKGQLISAIKYDEMTRVPSVSCSVTTLTIVNDKALHRAQIQSKMLQEKRRVSELEMLAQIFDARIKSLTPGCVKVRVKSGKMHSEYSERFDVAIRLIRSVIKRGLFSKERVPSGDNLPSYMPEEMPVESALAAFQFAATCLRLLQGSATLIA